MCSVTVRLLYNNSLQHYPDEQLFSAINSNTNMHDFLPPISKRPKITT